MWRRLDLGRGGSSYDVFVEFKGGEEEGEERMFSWEDMMRW